MILQYFHVLPHAWTVSFSKTPDTWVLVWTLDIWNPKGFTLSYSASRANTNTSKESGRITASSAKSKLVTLLLPKDAVEWVSPLPCPVSSPHKCYKWMRQRHILAALLFPEYRSENRPVLFIGMTQCFRSSQSASPYTESFFFSDLNTQQTYLAKTFVEVPSVYEVIGYT